MSGLEWNGCGAGITELYPLSRFDVFTEDCRPETDCCLLMLFMVDSRRRMLPTPRWRPVALPFGELSSCVMRTVRGLGFLCVGVGTVPAEICISSRKFSLSEANFLSASSKVASSSNPRARAGWTALIVVLLLLLPGVGGSWELITLPMLFRASKL